jgi:hypothetical protein
MTLEERIKEIEKIANVNEVMLNVLKSTSEGAYCICIAEQKLAKQALSIIQELQNKNKELEIKLLEKDKKLYICESNVEFFKRKLKESNNDK